MHAAAISACAEFYDGNGKNDTLSDHRLSTGAYGSRGAGQSLYATFEPFISARTLHMEDVLIRIRNEFFQSHCKCTPLIRATLDGSMSSEYWSFSLMLRAYKMSSVDASNILSTSI